MSLQLSDRVQRIKPSATIAVSTKAAELRAEGRDVIGLGTGEPDFDTPEHIKQAAIAAMKAGQTKYTAVDGTPELKQAIVDKLQRENGLSYETSQVIASSGAKHSLINLMLATINDGDEVVVPAPYWVSYPDMAALVGGKAVIVHTTGEDRFCMNPEQLREALSDRTRLLMMNSPSNPSGQVYSKAQLQALGEVLKDYPDVLIATDDIYEHIYWGDEPICNLANACPELKDRILVVNGVSKAYAMTGWRIGYTAGPEWVIAAMRKVQSQTTSNPCSISQAAATAALNGDQQPVRDMCKAFRERHDYITRALDELPGVSCLPCDGAFYALASFEEVIEARGFEDDVELAGDLLETAEVALVPGTAFGAPGHLRLSYATDMDTLKRAIERLKDYLA